MRISHVAPAGPLWLRGGIAMGQASAVFSVGTAGFGANDCHQSNQPIPVSCSAHYGIVGAGYSFSSDYSGFNLGGSSPLASSHLVGVGVNSGVPVTSGVSSLWYSFT